MTDNSFLDDSIRNHYHVKRKIGSGAYGSVWECLERGSRRRVAVKKIQEAFRNSQDAQRTYREVALLRAFRRHPNIVTLLEVRRASNNMDLYLVFEHMEIDLHQLITRKDFSLCDHHYRLITYQILKAIKYMHSGGIVHRDLKPSNILVNGGCVVKVGDLGLARTLRGGSQVWSSDDQLMTGYVATRWYRPPEILLSSKRYTRGVDMWSLGCILAEMIIGTPLFKGDNTESQLRLVMDAIHWPTPKDMDAVRLMGGSKLSVTKHAGRGNLGSVLSVAGSSPLATDLVEKLLVFNPEKRPAAAVALLHPYLSRISKGRMAPALRHFVTLSLRDDVQLTVDNYRQHLYKEIDSYYNKPTPTPTPLQTGGRKKMGDTGRLEKGDLSTRNNNFSALPPSYHKTHLPSLYPLNNQGLSRMGSRAHSVKTKTQETSSKLNRTCSVNRTSSINRTCSVNRTYSVNRTCSINRTCTVNRTCSVNRTSCVGNTRHTLKQQTVNSKQLYSASLPNLKPSDSAPSVNKGGQAGARKLAQSMSQDSGYLTGNSGS